MNQESQERGQSSRERGQSSRARGTSCAACAEFRRRCPPYCFLAPYFPHGYKQEFRNVKQLFGAARVEKVLKTVKPDDRSRAAKAMIFEAAIRLKDPSGGCIRIIQELQKKIQDLRDELSAVNNLIEQAKNNAIATLDGIMGPSVGDISAPSRDSTKKG